MPVGAGAPERDPRRGPGRLPAGRQVGQSFLACAFAHQACRQGYRACYRRASRLFHDLALARADGTYVRLLAKLARFDVLVIDDWALTPVQEPERRDLLELLEDRYGTRSTIMTSQLPPPQWHDYLADPALADAICDRIVHNAHRLVLKGPSRRKEGKLDTEPAASVAALRSRSPIWVFTLDRSRCSRSPKCATGGCVML